MDLNLLFHFTVLSEDMNLTKAARRCYLTQSTLSRQMASLEQQLGVTLFVRNHRILTLTPAGEHLKQNAPKLLEHAAQLEADLRTLSERGPGSSLRIATFSLTAPSFNRCLSAFRNAYPQVDISLKPVEPDDGLEIVLHQQYDLAFTTAMAINNLSIENRNKFAFHRVECSHACAVVHPAHPLAGQGHLHLSALKKYDIVTINDHSANQRLIQHFESVSFQPRHLVVADIRTLRYLVNSEQAVAILLDSVIQDVIDQGTIIQLEDCDLDVNLCFAWLKSTQDKVQPFLDLLTPEATS